MAQYGEYMGPSVQSPACSYATLSQYNNTATQSMASLASNVQYVTPTFNAPPGYGNVKSAMSSGGYTTLMGAYDKKSSGSGFIAKLCQ